MPSVFTQEGDAYVIRQSARGFRLGFNIFIGCGLFGFVIMALLGQIKAPTTLECDRARASCTLTKQGIVTEMPIATFVKTPLVENGARAYIELWRNQYPNYVQICGAIGDPVRARETAQHAEELRAFFADAARPTLSLSCLSQDTNMPSPFALMPLFLGGVLVLMLLFRPFSTVVETRLDRGANVIRVRGKRWLARRWHLERPLSDVVAIEQATRYGAYASRYFSLFAVFKDGASILIWAPGASSQRDVARRRGEIQQFIQARATGGSRT
jgi:hypothetical protein